MSVKKANAIANAFDKANSNQTSKKGKRSGPPGGQKAAAACPTCGQTREPGEGTLAEEKKDASE